jgi:hypothetical protein
MTIPVEIEGTYHNVYVIKRPGVDAFMKRVGELYEVVVFTASVSKVCCKPLFSPCIDLETDLNCSTEIHFWTSWTFTAWYTTDCSARVATTTKATMSRTFRKSDVISRRRSSSTTRPHHTFSILSTLYPSAVGSRTPTTTNFWTLSLCWKTLPDRKSATSA